MVSLELTREQYYHTLSLFEGYLNDLSENHDLTDPNNDWLAVDWQRYRAIYDSLVKQDTVDKITEKYDLKQRVIDLWFIDGLRDYEISQVLGISEQEVSDIMDLYEQSFESKND